MPYDYDYYRSDPSVSIMENEEWMGNVLNMCDQDYANAMFDAAIIKKICDQVAERLPGSSVH